MRVAVADIGTNSCHLLIAEGRASAAEPQSEDAAPSPKLNHFQVLDSLKERTRLGACLDAQGNLTSEGERRLLAALKQFQELAHAAGVSEVRAYATSALREAPNGLDVAERMREASGVYPVLISGEREGQLTYLGASHSVEFGADNLLLDLGGGSLELARGDAQQAQQVISLPLGSVRLHLRYLQVKSGALPRALAELREAVKQAVLPHRAAFGAQPSTHIFGSSGTFQAVGAAIAARQGDSGATESSVNGFTFEISALSALVSELAQLSPAQRVKAGIDPKRADIMLAGAAILETALLTLDARTATVSEGALREGMLIEELMAQARWQTGLSARQRSAAELAERFAVSLPHARQVTALAQNLLTRLQRQGEAFPEDARSLLSAAATLHEAGQLIALSAHHKHSAYLIRHGGLRGFSPRQIELIAQVARYHRKAAPRSTHPEFQALGPEDRFSVQRLAAVLRVADGLDRAHTGQTRIHDLHREGTGEHSRWVLTVGGACALDLSGARDKAEVWQHVYGPLRVVEAE